MPGSIGLIVSSPCESDQLAQARWASSSHPLLQLPNQKASADVVLLRSRPM